MVSAETLVFLLIVSVGANFVLAISFYNLIKPIAPPEVHVHELKLEDLDKDDLINFVKHQNAELKTAIKKAIGEE